MSKWQDIVHGKCIERVPQRRGILPANPSLHDPRKYEEIETESIMERSGKYRSEDVKDV